MVFGVKSSTVFGADLKRWEYFQQAVNYAATTTCTFTHIVLFGVIWNINLYLQIHKQILEKYTNQHCLVWGNDILLTLSLILCSRTDGYLVSGDVWGLKLIIMKNYDISFRQSSTETTKTCAECYPLLGRK